ncbi:hypothetical protein BZA77DRAFT_294981 [Pyronema omphalodes]|nr:hypothetical protein BZA77DRAFT_294981 [Pyronema omphalodes]
MENVNDYPQKTNSSLADAATASASGSASNGSTVSQLQPVSGADTLFNEPVESCAAVQAVQYNAETLHLPRPRIDQSPHPMRTLPSPSPAHHYQYTGMRNGTPAVLSSSFDANLQTGSMVRQDGNQFRRDFRYHGHSTGANPAVTLPLQQAPPGFISTVYPSGQPAPQIPPHRQQVIPGTAAFEGVPSVTPTLRKTSHLPATPSSTIQTSTATTDLLSMSAPQDTRAPHVKPKRKRGSKDGSSALVAHRGDEQVTVVQDHPASSEAMPSTDSNTDDDSPTGPEDPDWDMWIKEPSTGKDGPSAKETLIAGKLDGETPVQWSAVTVEKQGQVIRRLRFWMGWTREKAETHLKKMSGKWFSDKKILPTTTNDTPLFLFSGDESDSDDDMAWHTGYAAIEAIPSETRSTYTESLIIPDSTVDVADEGTTEQPQ